jgi:hypothetical protein
MIGEQTASHAIIHRAGVEDNYMLLELPEELMHEDLEIRGSPEDEAVLCTANKTFKLRSVQISNTQLVIDESDQVNFTGSSYLEIFPTKGNVERIKSVLALQPYCGPDMDDTTKEIVSMEWLKENIPACDAEIQEALKDAVLINNSYRALSRPYIKRFLDILFLLIVSESWDPQNLDTSSIIEAFDVQFSGEFTRDVVEHLFQRFCECGKQLSSVQLATFFAHELFLGQKVLILACNVRNGKL